MIKEVDATTIRLGPTDTIRQFVASGWAAAEIDTTRYKSPLECAKSFTSAARAGNFPVKVMLRTPCVYLMRKENDNG